MIQGIPWSYKECDVLRILAKLIGPTSFNFFYMPWNFQHNTNNGCAFVNFTTSEHALRCVEVMDGCTFQSEGGKSDGKVLKPCKIVPANLQGFDANLEYYRCRLVGASNHPHAPLIFQDGVCLSFQKAISKFCQNKPMKGNNNQVAEPNTEYIEDLCSTQSGSESDGSPAQSCMEFPASNERRLLANQLSLGASFDANSQSQERESPVNPQMGMPDFAQRLISQSDLAELFHRDLAITQSGAQPADRTTTQVHPSYPGSFFSEQHVAQAQEFALLRDNTIKALQESLDRYLSQQSLLYAMQLKQKASERSTKDFTSPRTPVDTLYTVTTASPRESMQTLSEPDDDICRDQVFPAAANRLMTPPPGLEHLAAQAPAAQPPKSLSHSRTRSGVMQQCIFRSN
jgi:hypothetical protein